VTVLENCNSRAELEAWYCEIRERFGANPLSPLLQSALGDGGKLVDPGGHRYDPRLAEWFSLDTESRHEKHVIAGEFRSMIATYEGEVTEREWRTDQRPFDFREHYNDGGYGPDLIREVIIFATGAGAARFLMAVKEIINKYLTVTGAQRLVIKVTTAGIEVDIKGKVDQKQIEALCSRLERIIPNQEMPTTSPSITQVDVDEPPPDVIMVSTEKLRIKSNPRRRNNKK
jgi:hypothetical protein